MKKIRWNKHAREFVHQLSKEARSEIGSLLLVIQCGRMLTGSKSKHMNNIHPNAHELRIKDGHGIYRIIYVLNFGDEILIPHAFTKKTQKTPLHEINVSKIRLQELLNENK